MDEGEKRERERDVDWDISASYVRQDEKGISRTIRTELWLQRARAYCPIGLLRVAFLQETSSLRAVGFPLSVTPLVADGETRERRETPGKVSIPAFDYASRSDCTAPASIGILYEFVVRRTLDESHWGLCAAPALKYVAFENSVK